MLSSTLPSTLSNTLPFTLHGTHPASLTVRSQVSSHDAFKHTPSLLHYMLWGKITKCSQALSRVPPRKTLRIALDGTLTVCLTVRSRVSSQCALKHTPEHTPKYTVQLQDTPNLTWLYAVMYAPGCSIQRLAELQAPGTGRQVAGGGRWEVGGGRRVSAADIITSVDIIVWTSLSAWTLRPDLTIAHGYGVHNYILRFCNKGRQLDLGESRSPTQIFQQNLLRTSHRQ